MLMFPEDFAIVSCGSASSSGSLVALVHKDGRNRSREQILEGCDYDRFSPPGDDFIPEYRESIRLGSLGTNPKLHYVARSCHKALYMATGSYREAPSTSLSYCMCLGWE